MPIPLPKYAKIKDNYCIGYFGTDPNVVQQLKRARPFIEKELPGLKLFISCPDEMVPLLGEDRVVPGSQLAAQVDECRFAYYRELSREESQVVRAFLTESKIPFPEEILNAPA